MFLTDLKHDFMPTLFSCLLKTTSFCSDERGVHRPR